MYMSTITCATETWKSRQGPLADKLGTALTLCIGQWGLQDQGWEAVAWRLVFRLLTFGTGSSLLFKNSPLKVIEHSFH